LHILEKIKQYIAIANDKFYKRNTFNLNCTTKYLMQVMYHMCSKDTIPSKP